MRKTAFILSVSLLISLILTGCEKEPEALPDTYVDGSDYQYMQRPEDRTYLPLIQEHDDTVYIMNNVNGYIYYMDSGSDVILPLCNKADCLHDRETDLNKKEECNAFITDDKDVSLTGIQYCNGYIYSLDPDCYDLDIGLGAETLYRCAPDGSKKEIVCRWDRDDGPVAEWMVHRDVLYYFTRRYVDEGDWMREEWSLVSMPLSGGGGQPQVIYTSSEDLQVTSLSGLVAYGNHIFCEQISFYPGVDVTADNFYDLYYCKNITYDTESGKISFAENPNLPYGLVSVKVTFWQDKVIPAFGSFVTKFEELNEMSEQQIATQYILELDGSDPEVLEENVSPHTHYMSDGKYLYKVYKYYNDDYTSSISRVDVFDSDMSLIDTFTLPKYYTQLRWIGTSQRQYTPFFTFSDDITDQMYFVASGEFVKGNIPEGKEWGLVVWDKSGMGSYNGSSPEAKLIWR